MKSTLIIGSSVCDVNIYVQQFPQITGDENIIKQEMTMGGCAWNVSAVFRQLQLPYTLFSPIGKGFYGDFVKAQFQKNHVPVLIETSQKNGCCYCVVDKQGERTFLCEHGAEYVFHKEWFTQLDMSLYQAIYICGLDIEEDHKQVIYQFLKQYPHHTLYFAPGPRLFKIPQQAMHNILPLHPILHLNKQEILAYTHQNDLENACKILYTKTQQPIIITLGQEGCYFYNQTQNFYIPTQKVPVFNTNGAGDTHLGAIMAYRIQGDNWKQSLQKANDMAAMKISKNSVK